MQHEVRAVIFDLDGTLVDSAVSIAATLNDMRSRRGIIGAISVHQVRQWVSLGARDLVCNALEVPSRDVDANVAEFRSEYANIKTASDCLYPGAVDTLQSLGIAGFPMAVCSNKPQDLCVRVLLDTGIRDRFAAVLGGDIVPKAKPHPSHLLAAVRALGVAPAEAIYVGDSSIDLRASRAADVPFVLARYGYADPALHTMIGEVQDGIDSLSELLAMISSRSPGLRL